MTATPHAVPEVTTLMLCHQALIIFNEDPVPTVITQRIKTWTHRARGMAQQFRVHTSLLLTSSADGRYGLCVEKGRHPVCQVYRVSCDCHFPSGD